MKNATTVITDQVITDKSTMDIKPLFFHIGWMRTGTTFMQGLFRHNQHINISLKNRFFSYNPYYKRGTSFYQQEIIQKNQHSGHQINIDSDENYSMGRFKTHVREACKVEYNHKSELNFIYHDIAEMVNRMKDSAPEAKVFGIIRKQPEWFESVYKHDVYHFGLDQNFSRFYESELGLAYRNAADYCSVYKMFAEAFGRENTKILLFEDFVKEPALFHAQLGEFLETDIHMDKSLTLKKNASTNNFFTKLHCYVNQLSEKNPAKKESNTYRHLRNTVNKLDRLSQRMNIQVQSEVIPANTRTAIKERYAQGNEQLAQALNLEDKMKQYGYF